MHFFWLIITFCGTTRIGLHALMLKTHLIILRLFIAAEALSAFVRRAQYLGSDRPLTRVGDPL